MRKLFLAACVCLASAAAWRGSGATEPVPMPHPDDGVVKNEIFTSTYFNLSYPLPSGWTEGTVGPGPSVSGYYVLTTLIPKGDFTATILVAAQDTFFAAKSFADAAAMTQELSRALSAVEGMTIDRPPSEVQIAGRRFSRVDFSGVGLFRSTLTTEIRCHFVSFNLTAKSPELLADLVLSLNRLRYVGDSATGTVDPTCISHYAEKEHLLAKVDPPAITPALIPIPVRIVISTDGTVEHVHVIRATGAQRDAIENALGQWKFRPPEMGGNATEIETGLLIEFTPNGSVKYPTGNRSPL
jgi:Gram-negative bacterial TonB protein C-terminal